MVVLSRIYTRGGDAGQTSLGDGVRVPKDSLRIEAIGAVDEANAAIGVARLALDGEMDAIYSRVQNDLFDLGADLCIPDTSKKSAGALRIVESQVQRLEREIDVMNEKLAPLTSFVLPGGKSASAYLHLARTSVRRAERILVSLKAQENVGAEALAYINRLSDHLFVAARFCNDEGKSDVLWTPGKNR